MFGASTLAGMGLGALVFFGIGCVKQGEVLRTPEQWRADIAADMESLIPDFRACYVKSKAGWSERASSGAGDTSIVSSTVAAPTQLKSRETILLTIDVDAAAMSDHPEARVEEGDDDKVAKSELTSDTDLANCVRRIASTKLKTPQKVDTNHGYGKWRIVFVRETKGLSPAQKR